MMHGDKLGTTSKGLNEELAKAIEDSEINDPDVVAKLENEMKENIISLQQLSGWNT